MTYDIYLTTTDVRKFHYTPDMEDASDAAVVAELDLHTFEFQQAKG